ncbi:MAG: fumarylacetoacetate hydrolase family protein [Gemmatimonadota bacterium]|nr:MAG: fumarylacetoacetate hydrolase family protein [Gemmatimonadota bacterium]
MHPSKIVCVGRNYRAHAKELGSDVPSEPLLFLKATSSIIAAGEAIRLPQWAGRVDFEGEIAVLIGACARNLTAEDAWSHVAGVFPLNDVTARELQRSDGQWARAKSLDTFCPMGTPVPVAASELADLSVVTRVNGEVRQEGYARDMIFPIPELIAYASRAMTLREGDVISSGTPEGVGPLSPGDVVEVEIPSVGAVSNPVVRDAG